MIIAIVVVVAVLGIGAFSLSQKSSETDSMISKENTVMKDTDGIMKKDDKMAADKLISSRYVEYSKATLDNASSTRRILFFYASWCPTCKAADASFKENESKIPEDVTLIRVNYNDPDTDQEEKDLAKKYSITYQHTYVQIDETGKEITLWNGGQIDELLSTMK